MNWPRAILFDLDGTLADTAPDIADALNLLLTEQGLAAFMLDEVTNMVGGGVPRLIERALMARGGAADGDRINSLAARFVELYAPRAADKTRLFPGARDVVGKLHGEGVRLGVCTNKPEAVTRAILSALDVSSLFRAVIGGDTLPVRKPDPAPVLAALAQLECDVAHGLMVGDSETDSMAGRAAGIPVLLVTFGYTLTPVREIDNDGMVESFAALPDAINKLGKSRA